MEKPIVLFILFVIGCAGIHEEKKTVPFSGRIAVAPFEHPENLHEVLSGYIVKNSGKIDNNVLKKLTRMLLEEIHAKGKINIVPPTFVNQCKEIILYRESRAFLNPVQKWIEIGRCIPVDFIVVPQLFVFKPRIGGEFGVYEPAKVMFSLNVIDVKKGSVVKSYLFREEQKPLSENLLDIKKFLKRGGRWISVYELAKEGIEQALKEIGL